MKTHTTYLGKKIPTETIRKIESLTPSKREKIYKKLKKPRSFSFGKNWNIDEDNLEMSFNSGDKKICSQKLLIPRETRNELRQLCQTIGKKNKKGEFKHQEVGGLLDVIKHDDYYIVKPNKTSFLYGEKDGTDVPIGRIGFHTHPYGEYRDQGVKYAWPSGDDYMAILEKMLDPKENGIAHIVVTKEGMYVISFSPKGLELGKKHYKKNDTKKKMRKYKIGLPPIEERISMGPREYVKKIKNFRDPLFNVEFCDWNSQRKIPIYFPDNQGSCEP